MFPRFLVSLLPCLHVSVCFVDKYFALPLPVLFAGVLTLIVSTTLWNKALHLDPQLRCHAPLVTQILDPANLDLFLSCD